MKAALRPAAEARSADERGLGPRNAALVAITVVAVVFALHWARNFFVALLLGILIAYALDPVVSLLCRLRVPRWAAASVTMLALCGVIGAGAMALGGQLRAVIEDLPAAARRVSAHVGGGGDSGTLEKLQTAAREIEKAAERATGAAPSPRAAPPPPPPAFRLSAFLLGNMLDVVSLAGYGVMVLFLTFFLLLAGDAFEVKMLRIAGPSLESRKVTRKVLKDIHASVQTFLLVLAGTNVLLVALCWVAFSMVGLENPGGWALVGGLLHLVPYVGPVIFAAVLGVTAYAQFGTFEMALTVVLISLVIAGVSGMLLATWMAGRLSSINTAAMFIALLFWGWLWGFWGLLLAIPLTVIAKIAAELIEPLHPVAEMLRA
jgi:predicted PurR-regulated permease PerM